MDVIVWKGNWSVEDARSKPTYIFLFGDNLQKKGLGGQAIIRYELNAFGIPTKRYPNLFPSAFMTDTTLDFNMKAIDNAINDLEQVLSNYDGIVISEAGLGTGLARLNTKAPETFKYLKKRIVSILEDNVKESTKSADLIKW